jgi:hypothetical protein
MSARAITRKYRVGRRTVGAELASAWPQPSDDHLIWRSVIHQELRAIRLSARPGTSIHNHQRLPGGERLIHKRDCMPGAASPHMTEIADICSAHYQLAPRALL